jgi:DNA repair protein RecO
MQTLEKSVALVLKKRVLPRDDMLVVLFTGQQGKLAAYAKGIRSITSKRSPHIQTGNLIEVQLRQNNNNYYLQQTSLLSAFQDIKNDLKRMNYAYAAFFVLDNILPELEPEPQVMESTLKYLSRLSKKDSGYGLLFVSYLEEIAATLGFLSDEEQPDIIAYIEQLIDAKIPLE